MWSILLNYLRLTLSLFIFLLAAPSTLAANLNVYLEDVTPFSYVKNGQAQGMSVDLARQIMKQVDNSQQIKVVPWARGWRYASENKNVALFTMSWTEARAKAFSLLGPITIGELNLYALKSFVGDELDADPNLWLPAIRSGICYETLSQMNLSSRLYPVTKTIQAIKMVKKHRAQFFCAHDYMVNNLIQKAGFSMSDFKKIRTLMEDKTYIAFSKGSEPGEILEWKAALERLHQEGVVKQIFQKWLPHRRHPNNVELIGVPLVAQGAHAVDSKP